MPRRKSKAAYAITPELLKRVEQYAAQGLTIEQICSCLDWNPDTLYNKKKQHTELAEAIKRGQDKGIQAVTNALFKNAMSGNLGAQVFYLKNRARWSDVQKQEHSGPDGGPIETKSEVDYIVVDPKDD